MAKTKQKTSWLYIALGVVVGLGAIMGAVRLFSKDEGVDRSELGVNMQTAGVNVEGYELMLAYDDADKILDICRSAMEDLDSEKIQPGHSYQFDVEYGSSVSEMGLVVSLAYDYGHTAEDDKLVVLVISNPEETDIPETIITVDKSGISGQPTGYVLSNSIDPGAGLWVYSTESYKVVFGDRNRSHNFIDCGEANTYMPKEIVKLVRLVAPAA